MTTSNWARPFHSTGPLFPPGQSDAFLNLILSGPVADGSAPHPLSDHRGSRDAAHTDLELMISRSYIALAHWALPVLPKGGQMDALRLPDGAHPTRVSQYFLEGQASGHLAQTYPVALWRDAMLRRMSERWVSVAVSDEGVSALTLLSVSTHPPIDWGLRPHGLPSYRARIGVWHGEMAFALAAAARIRTAGPLASQEVVATDAALADARSVVCQAFRQHVARQPFPTPALQRADLLFIESMSRPGSRTLTITLAADVDVSTQPAA